MKKYFLFDLDGTLTDPFEGITKAVAYALERFGIHIDDRQVLAPFIGPPLWESFEKYYGMSHAESIRAVEVYREYFRDTGIFENTVYPGVPEMLGSLRDAGASLVLATSKPKVFADRILEHFSLDKFFTYTDGSELDGTRVNKDEVIAHALETLGARADDCVMTGDRMHDISGAKKNRIDSVGVLYGYGDRAELEAAGAGAIAESVGALGELLLGMLR